MDPETKNPMQTAAIPAATAAPAITPAITATLLDLPGGMMAPDELV